MELYFHQLKKVARWYVDRKLKNCPIRINQFGLDASDEHLGGKRFIWGCGAARGRISITAEGKIQGCAKIQGLNDLKGLIDMGDVWNGFTDHADRIALSANSLELRKICSACDLADECCGGCPAVSHAATGSVFVPDRNECRFTEIAIKTKAYVAPRIANVMKLTA